MQHVRRQYLSISNKKSHVNLAKKCDLFYNECMMKSIIYKYIVISNVVGIE